MNSEKELNYGIEEVTSKGWVEKKTTGMISLWKKRYLILRFNKLKYFHHETDEKFAGILDFDVLTVQVDLKGNTFVLKIVDSPREFKFRCPTEQEAHNWVYIISISLQQSYGSKMILPISAKKKYWKYDRISASQFAEEVQTGDLLLFRGKSALSKMQRAVTRGKYDHVALLVRCPSNNIFLFEVTGQEGVAMLLWDDFLFYQWQNLYSRLMYRKLHWSRPEELINKLYDFIEKAKGMDYKLSAGKLMRKRQDKNLSDKKGFFCSELIATAYKECDLISKDKPSSKYWPGDFDDKKLQILPPASMDAGLLIDFDII